MRMTANLSDMIDRYITGRLSGEELLRFEKLLREDPALAEEVGLHRELASAIASRDETELRKKLLVAHAEYESQRRPTIVRTLVQYSRTAAAALLVLAVAVVAYQWIFGRTYTAEQLFEKYYTPYEMQVFRSAGSLEVSNLMDRAVKEYNKQNFESAIIYFEQVLIADNNRMDANLMSGISKIELERYRDANTNFQHIINHRDNLYLEHACWYLAMCYLKTGETEKAKDQFIKIVIDDGYYRKEAGKILRKL